MEVFKMIWLILEGSQSFVGSDLSRWCGKRSVKAKEIGPGKKEVRNHQA